VERVVEKVVEVEKVIKILDNDSLDLLSKDNRSLKQRIQELESQLKDKPEVVERVVEVERQVPVEVERASSGDLRTAAKLLSRSEFNKEDLSEDDIYAMLVKGSEDEVKRKLGFWAVPLPKRDQDHTDSDKKYIGKK
jgi:hypothetical protein